MPEAEKITTATAVPKKTTAAPPGWASLLKGLISSLAAKKPAAQTPAVKGTGKAPTSINLAEKGRIYDPFAWVRHILLWTNLQIVLLAVACVVVTIMAYTVKNRGLMVIDLPDSLRERAYKLFDLKDVDRDEFDRFTTGVLTSMHQYDYRNTPNVDLLKGLVNPDIYTAVQTRYLANSALIRSKGIVHDLHITAIENVFPSVNRKRYSATVKGYLNVSSFVQDKKEARFMPYRARVVVRVQPNSVINKSGYYLLQIHEFAGDEAARRFDAEIAAELEKKGLK